jgi:uncharacterized protein YgbK (DUF1537 family)
MALALGAVADDFTGASDLASMTARGGLRTELLLGRPAEDATPSDAQVVVAALKSRTAPVEAAVADSLAAWRWMAKGGARRCYFKYCSTFDSTARGNIGPVAQALMAETGAMQTVYTPAFPENGRSIYCGKLFVGAQLLSESGMRDHPLTPMRDSDLPRLLQAQLRDARAGLADWPTVRRGAPALRERLAALAAEGVAHVVVDGLEQADLDVLAEVVADWPLVTAGSGLGLSLARRLAGADAAPAEDLPGVGGPVVMLSGSCSQATNAQVARWRADGGAVARLDPVALGAEADVEGLAGAALEGALIASTNTPEAVQAAQQALGVEGAAEIVERTLAAVACAARDRGARRFVVAGGETSGAVASALGVARLAVGPSIAPGVPWCASLGGEPVALAMKSGNFGAVTFFADAKDCAP